MRIEQYLRDSAARDGAKTATRQGSNVYGSWGSTSVVRGDDWAQTNRVTNRVTGNTTRVTRTDDGAAVSRRNPGQGGGFVAAVEGGDVYAGRDGNVYRREDGTWQKHDNGGWSNVDRPNNGATVDQLERDRSSRSSGASS